MKIWLHADDIGVTAGVTAGILKSWQSGVLDGFSIIANGDAILIVREALLALPQQPARLVAHLNLSEGPSIAPPEQIPLLIDRFGNLKHGFGSLAISWIMGSAAYRRALVAQVEIEWRAQVLHIRKIIEPRQLSGIDGHIHVHMLPFLFATAAKIAHDNAIPEIRISREPFFVVDWIRDLTTQYFLVNLLKHFVLRLCAMPATELAQKHGLSYPSLILGVLYTGHMTATAALDGILAAQQDGAESVQIIFHIGRATDDDKRSKRSGLAKFNCSSDRDREFRQLGLLHAILFESGKRSRHAISRAAMSDSSG